MQKIIVWLVDKADALLSNWERRTREAKVARDRSQLEQYNHDHPPQQKLF